MKVSYDLVWKEVHHWGDTMICRTGWHQP